MNNIFTGNTNNLTLHIRITKKCNADCSYCSSFEANASDLMSIDDLRKSLSFIKQKIISLKLGGERNLLTVQYIGGELLTVSTEYLKEYTSIVKNELSPLFKDFKHGGQSNLIGSFNKIDSLFDIFNNNIGTSFDNYTAQRTVKQNPSKYRTIFLKNVSHIKKNYGKNISGIIVLDKKMAPFIQQEVNLQDSKRRHLTIRPVFNGGSPINGISIKEMNDIMGGIYDNWALNQQIIIEPFYSYFIKRFENRNGNSINLLSGCPSQHNCATVSLNLEPNGDLYTCMDLADSKHLPFGNAIKGTFSDDIFNLLNKRTDNLSKECIECDYFKECQGGCMLESIEHHNDIYGKTNYCSIWKMLFAKIDNTINKNSKEDIQKWIDKITKY